MKTGQFFNLKFISQLRWDIQGLVLLGAHHSHYCHPYFLVYPKEQASQWKQQLPGSDLHADRSRKSRTDDKTLLLFQALQQLWEGFLFLRSPMQSALRLKFTVAAISREELGAELRFPFFKCFLVLIVQKSHLWRVCFFLSVQLPTWHLFLWPGSFRIFIFFSIPIPFPLAK